MAQSLGAFAKKIERVGDELNGEAARKRLTRVAVETKKDVDEAVKGDLGDTSMSGWRRGKPFDIKGRFDIKSDAEFEVNPVPRGRGPMRVLEQGRNQGGAGGFHGPGVAQRDGKNVLAGETARNKNGKLRKVRTFKAKRWNGRTQGKGTWSDAVGLMQDRVPARIATQFHKDLLKILGKG
jgi:hypothetical protein